MISPFARRILSIDSGLFSIDRLPRANEVRVKVPAPGVSFADILMRKGVHPESWNLGILEERHLLQGGMLLALLIN